MSKDKKEWVTDRRIVEQLSRLVSMDVSDMDMIAVIAMEVHNLTPPFDWMDWDKGGDAYKNPGDLRQFPLEDVARYLTAMIRLDRMSGEFVLSQASDEEALAALKVAVASALNPQDGMDSQ